MEVQLSQYNNSNLDFNLSYHVITIMGDTKYKDIFINGNDRKGRKATNLIENMTNYYNLHWI
jgi:hypothetical protein